MRSVSKTRPNDSVKRDYKQTSKIGTINRRRRIYHKTSDKNTDEHTPDYSSQCKLERALLAFCGLDLLPLCLASLAVVALAHPRSMLVFKQRDDIAIHTQYSSNLCRNTQSAHGMLEFTGEDAAQATQSFHNVSKVWTYL
jgi:hypothetical protein